MYEKEIKRLTSLVIKEKDKCKSLGKTRFTYSQKVISKTLYLYKNGFTPTEIKSLVGIPASCVCRWAKEVNLLKRKKSVMIKEPIDNVRLTLGNGVKIEASNALDVAKMYKYYKKLDKDS